MSTGLRNARNLRDFNEPLTDNKAIAEMTSELVAQVEKLLHKLVPRITAVLAEPEAAEPDAAEPDAAEPDAAEPDAAEPDAAEPEPLPEPDAAEPDRRC